MTQPIQEPTTDRALQGFAYARDQIFRRPAPQPGNTTTSAYLDDLIANGTGLEVASNNWETVTTAVDGANTRWLDEFNYDPDKDWSVEFEDGAIFNDGGGVAYNYSTWAYVVFDGVANGTIIGAAVAVGGEFHVNTIEVVDGGDEVGVYVERTPLGIAGVRSWCYQNSGAPASITQARLHVRRFELYENVYIQEFATS